MDQVADDRREGQFQSLLIVWAPASLPQPNVGLESLKLTQDIRNDPVHDITGWLPTRVERSIGVVCISYPLVVHPPPQNSTPRLPSRAGGRTTKGSRWRNYGGFERDEAETCFSKPSHAAGAIASVEMRQSPFLFASWDTALGGPPIGGT